MGGSRDTGAERCSAKPVVELDWHQAGCEPIMALSDRLIVGLLAGLFFIGSSALAQETQTAKQRLAIMGIAPTPERLTQFAAQGDSTVVGLLLQSGLRIN